MSVTSIIFPSNGTLNGVCLDQQAGIKFLRANLDNAGLDQARYVATRHAWLSDGKRESPPYLPYPVLTDEEAGVAIRL